MDNDISFYRNKGSVLILGDFNAKTGSEPDFIVNDDNSYILLHDDYIIDNTLLRRNSQDIKVCTRGRDLLDVCISSGIRILNGRTVGDFKGKYTSYQYNGNSVIDYCLISEEQLSNGLYFHVEDPVLRLSDHSKISLRLMARFQQNVYKECPHSFPEQFKWESISPRLFNELLQREEIKQKLDVLSNISVSETLDINSVVTNFKELLLSVANVSLKKKKLTKGRNNKHRKWFNSDLHKMRKTLDYKGKLMT